MRLSSTVHFVGIGGIGMSALARILLGRGYHVSGSSDRATPLLERLAQEGAVVCVGHDARNLGDAGTVAYTSAVGSENPEVAAARERGLDVVGRGDLLARIMEGSRGIAIAGTHGKTTTTAMTAWVLERAGFDPTSAVGGELLDWDSNARLGAGEWFVAESDESDGSFLALRPEVAIVTNVENDHVESDEQFEDLVAKFARFARDVPADGLVAVGTDSPRALEIARAPRAARTRTFGLGPADVRALDVRHGGFGTASTIAVDGDTLGELRLQVPGEINVLNALATLAVTLELGISFHDAAAALGAFRGVRRRFEFLAKASRLHVVDDYAHHPTAVAATLAAARANWPGPIVVAFEPHRYSRTELLAADFAEALCGVEHVVLAPVYAASEAPRAGIDAHTIGELLRARGRRVTYVDDVAALPEHLLAQAPAGALGLCLGAGSITQAAAHLARAVAERAA